MEDRVQYHTAKINKHFRIAYNIKNLSWPASSPDFNPIENAWNSFKKKLHKCQWWSDRERRPNIEVELLKAIEEEWNGWDQEMFDSWVEVYLIELRLASMEIEAIPNSNSNSSVYVYIPILVFLLHSLPLWNPCFSTARTEDRRCQLSREPAVLNTLVLDGGKKTYRFLI